MLKKLFTPLFFVTIVLALLVSACAPSAKDVAIELATLQAGQAQTLTAPLETSPVPTINVEATKAVLATEYVATLMATQTTAEPIGGCGQTGRNGDEINVNDHGVPCATMPLNSFLAIMNAAKGSMPYPYINLLDRAFEGDINAGYQFRNEIPATIPAAQPAQRVMWGSLDWIRELTASQQTAVEKRILRLRCDGNNPCVYLLVDGDEFEVGWPGRGILLSEPLNPERDFPWWGK